MFKSYLRGRSANLMFGVESAATVFHLRATGLITPLLVCLTTEAKGRLSLNDMVQVVAVNPQLQSPIHFQPLKASSSKHLRRVPVTEFGELSQSGTGVRLKVATPNPLSPLAHLAIKLCLLASEAT